MSRVDLKMKRISLDGIHNTIYTRLLNTMVFYFALQMLVQTFYSNRHTNSKWHLIRTTNQLTDQPTTLVGIFITHPYDPVYCVCSLPISNDVSRKTCVCVLRRILCLCVVCKRCVLCIRKLVRSNLKLVKFLSVVFCSKCHCLMLAQYTIQTVWHRNGGNFVLKIMLFFFFLLLQFQIWIKFLKLNYNSFCFQWNAYMSFADGFW